MDMAPEDFKIVTVYQICGVDGDDNVVEINSYIEDYEQAKEEALYMAARRNNVWSSEVAKYYSFYIQKIEKVVSK